MEPLVAEPVEIDRPALVRAGPPEVHARMLALVGVASFVAARVLSLDGPALYTCPFRAATGVPCPSCGATHAFVHLAHGEFGQGLFASPLFALLALALWTGSAFTLARLVGLRWTLALPDLRSQRARALRYAAVATIAANWAFVVFVSRGGAP
ncbi:MAG: DUF2752 domain-containing protein [Deltaproteobacteria bacterium]|nr:DUF2752 domain-containing protein [Deltaproteobacteria bacterium]